MAFEIIGNIVLLCIYIFLLINTRTLPEGKANQMSAADWPSVILFLLIVLTVANIISTYIKYRKKGEKIKISLDFFKTKAFFRIVIASIFCIAYPFGLKYIGFIPTSVLFIFAFMTLAGEKKWRPRIITSLMITVAFYLLFKVGLRVPLSRGVGLFREFALALERLF